MIIEFEDYLKTKYKAPYVNCIIGIHRFKARIDTGADLTCVPSYAVPDESDSALSTMIRGHNGIVERISPKIVTIVIKDLGSFYLQNGVLLTESPFGLIGLDILNLCNFSMVGGAFILELEKDS